MEEVNEEDSKEAMSPLRTVAENDICDTIVDAPEEANLKTLKKARFMWQIKGNYHLKNSNCELESIGSLAAQAEAGSSDKESMSCSTSMSAGESSVEPTNTPALCDHYPAASPAGMDSSSVNGDRYPPLPPLRIGATTVNCVVCDTFNENIRRASLSNDGERPSTPPLPTSHPDWNVRKWQTRQIAKAFMDNTINSVLDEMGLNPISESATDPDLDDVISSFNFPRDDNEEEEEEDESVENEGILSAIQRHGLQRHTFQSPSEISNRFRYSSFLPNEHNLTSTKIWSQEPVGEMYEADAADHASESNSEEDELVCCQDACGTSSCRCGTLTTDKKFAQGTSQATSSKSLSSSSVPFSKEETIDSWKTEKTNLSNQLFANSTFSDDEEDSCKKRKGKNILATDISKRRCMESNDNDSKGSFTSSSASSVSSSSSSASGSTVSPSGLVSQSEDRNSPTFGHFEFMDAAVAAAIQKKGLSALACQDL